MFHPNTSKHVKYHNANPDISLSVDAVMEKFPLPWLVFAFTACVNIANAHANHNC